MIVKVFQKNKNGKIEFTQKELENLLNEVYWDGYRANSTWTWTTPCTVPLSYSTDITADILKTNTTAITIGDKK